MSVAARTRPAAAERIVSRLVEAGVDHVFGIPGVHTLALYRALATEPRIRHVTTRHESAAVFAADGLVRVRGGIGVVAVTTGPGAFNTLGALSEADLDGTPILVLAGQIPSTLVGAGKGVLHETDDQAAAFQPVCGTVERPRTAMDAIAAVDGALDALRQPGARPAYVELPLDLLDEEVDAAGPRPATRPHAAAGWTTPDLERATGLLARASAPVIVAGGGVVRERATEELLAVATALDAPVLHSVPGRGSVPPGHPLDAGPLVPARGGAAALLADADVVLVAGDRLDDQTTRGWTLRLGTRLVHLVDRQEHLDRGYRAEVGHCGSVAAGLRAILETLGSAPRPSVADGSGTVGADRARACRDALRASVTGEAARVLDVVEGVRASLPPGSVVTCDSATIDSWTAFFWPASAPGRFLFPWGSAALGFALPAAIGASLADPRARVLAVCGDGGLLFTVAELGTAVQVGANVTVLVHDDAGYGSIAAYQRARGAPVHGTALGHVDLSAIAAAHGIPATRVARLDDLPAAVRAATAQPGPALVHLTAPVGQPW